MKVLCIKVYIRTAYCHSLKEKRMILRSIKGKLINKFKLSVAEVASQDNWKEIVLGISAVFENGILAGKSYNNIINFIEDNYDIEITEAEWDVIEF